MIKEGMFVRCPIDREYPYDPRIFVTGKVLSINEFNETAYIKFSDPFDQKKYFEYIIPYMELLNCNLLYIFIGWMYATVSR